MVLGATANGLILLLPLGLSEIPFAEVLSQPRTWVFAILATGFCLIEACSVSPTRHPCCQPAHSPWLPYLAGIVLLVGFWICLFDHELTLPGGAVLLTTAGAALMLAGILLRAASMRHLGVFFLSHVELLPSHRLVTHGIYSVVRHPSELGLLMICLGAAILLFSPSGLAFFCMVMLPLSLYRTSLEDSLLAKRFPLEFRRYRLVTPRLLPLAFWRNV